MARLPTVIEWGMKKAFGSLLVGVAGRIVSTKRREVQSNIDQSAVVSAAGPRVA